ncbi:MAG: hypothetical protein RML94_10330 [Bacteroidia bacterium]|nr:hypothetical protein [Bacteroidia bacterium]
MRFAALMQARSACCGLRFASVLCTADAPSACLTQATNEPISLVQYLTLYLSENEIKIR